MTRVPFGSFCLSQAPKTTSTAAADDDDIFGTSSKSVRVLSRLRPAKTNRALPAERPHNDIVGAFLRWDVV